MGFLLGRPVDNVIRSEIEEDAKKLKAILTETDGDINHDKYYIFVQQLCDRFSRIIDSDDKAAFSHAYFRDKKTLAKACQDMVISYLIAIFDRIEIDIYSSYLKSEGDKNNTRNHQERISFAKMEELAKEKMRQRKLEAQKIVKDNFARGVWHESVKTTKEKEYIFLCAFEENMKNKDAIYEAVRHDQPLRSDQEPNVRLEDAESCFSPSGVFLRQNPQRIELTAPDRLDSIVINAGLDPQTSQRERLIFHAGVYQAGKAVSGSFGFLLQMMKAKRPGKAEQIITLYAIQFYRK